MLSLQGPNAEKLVTEVTITNGLPCHDLAHMQATIADSKVTLIVVTHGAERGYDLVIPVTALPNVVSQIEEVGKRWSLSWIGVEAQDMLRIEAGVPTIYGVDITEENSLLETGQDRWVNFERQFAGFLLQTKQTIRRGAKIYDGEREVGTLTSCRFSPHTNSAVALGYVLNFYGAQHEQNKVIVATHQARRYSRPVDRFLSDYRRDLAPALRLFAGRACLNRAGRMDGLGRREDAAKSGGKNNG
jgi:glycine cleavage system aminomethyltransferase T